MTGEWKGYRLSRGEMTLALDLARAEIEGQWRTDLTQEKVDRGLVSLAEKGLIQMMEQEVRLDSMLAFVLRHYLARDCWMRLYDRRGEIRVARTPAFWVALSRNGTQWQVTPLENEEKALEEAMDFAVRARGHCFVQTGCRQQAEKAVRAGEKWKQSIPETWREMMEKEDA